MIVWVPPAVCVPVPVIFNAAAVAGDTATDKLVSDATGFVIEMVSFSGCPVASNNTIEGVATPFVNESVVDEPRLVPATVGTFPPGEFPAPANTCPAILPL